MHALFPPELMFRKEGEYKSEAPAPSWNWTFTESSLNMSYERLIANSVAQERAS